MALVDNGMSGVAFRVQQRNVRLLDFFRDIDQLRAGTVTRRQFRRVLSAAGVLEGASEGELQALEERYKRGASDFAYMDFLQELSLALEHAPKGTRYLTTDAMSATRTRALASLSATNAATRSPAAVAAGLAGAHPELDRMEDELLERILAENVDLLAGFRAFDAARCGRVTVAQFPRAFPIKVPTRLIDLVVEAYGAPPTHVDYMAWLEHLEAKRGTIPARAAYGAGTSVVGKMEGRPALVFTALQPQAAARSVQQLVHELAQAQEVHRVRLVDFFHDRDPARTGKLPAAAFESALVRLHLPGLVLDTEALGTLVQAYGEQTPMGDVQVTYTRLVADMDAEVAANGGALSATRQRSKAGIENEPLPVKTVLLKVRDTVRTRRINLVPVFRDFDMANKGSNGTRTCTRTRFERALTVNGIVLSTPEVELLLQRFRIDRPGEADSDAVDYDAFLDLVQAAAFDTVPPLSPAAVAMRAAIAQASTRPGTGGSVKATSPAKAPPLPEHTVLEVVESVAAQVQKRRIRLGAFMRDYDALRAGTIQADHFQSALLAAGLHLLDSDLKLLAAAYAHPTLPRTVCYEPFLQEVHEDVRPRTAEATLSRMASGPYAVPTETNAAALRQRELTLTRPEADKEVNVIIQRVRACVRTRGILLPPFFNDYDKTHTGLVTRTQFMQVLARHPLPLTPEDAEVLALHFTDAALPTHVRCKDFIAAVDDTENPETVRAAATTERLQKISHARSLHAAMSASQGHTATAYRASPTASMLGSAAEPTHATVMHKLHHLIAARGVRVNEFLKPELVDPLRKGLCSKTRFLAALDTLGLRLTAVEGAALLGEYEARVGEVDYERFLRDAEGMVEEALAAPGMGQLTPTRTVGVLSASRTGRRGANKEALLAAMEEDPALKRLLDMIARTTASRRLEPRLVLVPYDRLHKGRVTEHQFLSALSSMSIHLEPREAKLLLGALSLTDEEAVGGAAGLPPTPASVGIASNMISYEAFVAVVEDAAAAAQA